MNEYPTVSIALFDELGARAIFQVPVTEREYNLAEAYRMIRDSLLAEGFSITQPTNSPAARNKTERLKGYMWGCYDDKRGGFKPCLYLYSENARLEWPVITVYPEHFDRLPKEVLAKQPPEVGDVAIPAPKSSGLDRVKRYHPWSVEVNVEPKTNQNGEVIMNDQGYPKYYNFVSVVGQTIQTSEEPSQLEVLEALGQALWGNAWNKKRTLGVSHIGKQRKPAKELRSTVELNNTEIYQWTSALEEKLRGRVFELAEDLGYDDDDLANFITETTEGEDSDIEGVNGLALARLVTEMGQFAPA